MSLLPWLFDELERYRRPSFGDIYDQHFGQGLFNDELLRIPTNLLWMPGRSGYIRPWRALALNESGVSKIKNNKDGFKVNLDVQQFKPEELKVKVVDNFLVVEAKHEERTDQHGLISREFTRRYKLPDDIDASSLVSKLSTDGVLSLEAPKKAPLESNIREIPITHTNQPAVKGTSEADKKETEKMEEQ